MISNKSSLAESVGTVNILLQEIVNYIKINPDNYEKFKYKIKVPTGIIRNVYYDLWPEFKFLKTEALIKNISYLFIQSDFYLWLLNRTSIIGTLREMIIKSGIHAMASIAESLVNKYATNKSKSFDKQVNNIRTRGLIDDKLKNDLKWLWEIREGIHLELLKTSELSKYKKLQYERAIKIIGELTQQLRNKTKIESKKF